MIALALIITLTFCTTYGNRTRDSSVKGRRLNPLTNAALISEGKDSDQFILHQTFLKKWKGLFFFWFTEIANQVNHPAVVVLEHVRTIHFSSQLQYLRQKPRFQPPLVTEFSAKQ